MSEMISPHLPETRKPVSLSTSGYNVAIGYLRAFIIVLVVAVHSTWAYFPFPPDFPHHGSLADYEKMYWQSFPVLDSQKWELSWIFVNFNEFFFMQLMLFLSGLFLWRDLQKRGSGNYLSHRAIRLGLPFLVVLPLMFAAYYPTWLQAGAPGGVGAYLKQWKLFEYWPIGPLWFILLLLVFDCLATILYMLAPHWGDRLGKMISGVSKQPVIFFISLLVISLLAYLPLALIFGTQYWISFGKIFSVQVERLLFNFIWFLAGVAVGAWGIDRGLLAENGNLALRWPLWIVAALAAFLVAIIPFLNQSPLDTFYLKSFDAFGFVFSCTATSFAFLAVFIRFAKRHIRVFDNLSSNSYSIFLLHYPIVSWTQYAFLKVELPGFVKFIFVFALAITISWILSATLRSIPVVRKVI